jgi:hypothetical protein
MDGELMELKTEHGYMEIAVDIYTGLVERSERLAVYEELMRGYNPVTVIIAGKKHIRKKQKKEERKEREQIQAEFKQASDAISIYAYRAGSGAAELVPSPDTCPAPDTCPDPGKMLSLLRAGWTKYDLAAEFNTDPETIVAWASRYSINPDKAEVPENE